MMLSNFLGVLAALGFLASVACHILGWLEIEPPGGKAVFALHLGIFVVLVPLIALIGRHTGGRRLNWSDPIFDAVPRWMKTATGVLFGYAIVHFVVFVMQSSQLPKGKVPLYLEVRGFSGHWMFFYAAATVAFIGFNRLRRSDHGDITTTRQI